MLHDLVKLLMAEQKDYYPLEGLPVGSFIFVDRSKCVITEHFCRCLRIKGRKDQLTFYQLKHNEVLSRTCLQSKINGVFWVAVAGSSCSAEYLW